jgi:hypothetical protein
MSLLDLIKEKLRNEDKEVFSIINFNKSNDEIIVDIIEAGIVKFDSFDKKHDD